MLVRSSSLLVFEPCFEGYRFKIGFREPYGGKAERWRVDPGLIPFARCVDPRHHICAEQDGHSGFLGFIKPPDRIPTFFAIRDPLHKRHAPQDSEGDGLSYLRPYQAGRVTHRIISDIGTALAHDGDIPAVRLNKCEKAGEL